MQFFATYVLKSEGQANKKKKKKMVARHPVALNNLVLYFQMFLQYLIFGSWVTTS